jgi:hypothetical protein
VDAGQKLTNLVAKQAGYRVKFPVVNGRIAGKIAADTKVALVNSDHRCRESLSPQLTPASTSLKAHAQVASSFWVRLDHVIGMVLISRQADPESSAVSPEVMGSTLI